MSGKRAFSSQRRVVKARREQAKKKSFSSEFAQPTKAGLVLSCARLREEQGRSRKGGRGLIFGVVVWEIADGKW